MRARRRAPRRRATGTTAASVSAAWSSVASGASHRPQLARRPGMRQRRLRMPASASSTARSCSAAMRRCQLLRVVVRRPVHLQMDDELHVAPSPLTRYRSGGSAAMARPRSTSSMVGDLLAAAGCSPVIGARDQTPARDAGRADRVDARLGAQRVAGAAPAPRRRDGPPASLASRVRRERGSGTAGSARPMTMAAVRAPSTSGLPERLRARPRARLPWTSLTLWVTQASQTCSASSMVRPWGWRMVVPGTASSSHQP